MSEISNADIYNVLLDLKGTMGELKGTMSGHAKALADHVAADALMAKDIQSLQISSARQRGVLAALTTIGTVLGAGAGYAIDLLTMRGGHH